MGQKSNLVEVIKALRADLSAAIEAGNGEVLQFDVNEIEVELKTILEEGRTGDGGFNFSVIKFGGSFNDKESVSHTIKLKLSPVVPSAEVGEAKTSNKARISGKATRIS